MTQYLGDLPFAMFPDGKEFIAVGFCAATLGMLILICLGAVRRKPALCVLCCTLALCAGLATQGAVDYKAYDVAVFPGEYGCCAVLENGDGCIVVGTGDDKYSAQTVSEYIDSHKLGAVKALIVPSPPKAFGRQVDSMVYELNPELVIVHPDVDCQVDCRYADTLTAQIYDYGKLTVEINQNWFIIKVVTDARTLALVGGIPQADLGEYDVCIPLDGDAQAALQGLGRVNSPVLNPDENIGTDDVGIMKIRVRDSAITVRQGRDKWEF